MALLRNIQHMISFMGKSSAHERLVKGVKVLSAEPGKVRFQMEVKQEHLNTAGTLHGGMICTLVDAMSSYAIATTKENKFGVSVDLNVTFLSAAFPGEKVIIETDVLRTGRNLAYANVNILKEDGKLVATGRHTKYLQHGNEPTDPDMLTNTKT